MWIIFVYNSPYFYSLLPENMMKSGRFIVDTLYVWLFHNVCNHTDHICETLQIKEFESLTANARRMHLIPLRHGTASNPLRIQLKPATFNIYASTQFESGWDHSH
jgi:hypothetical protein